MRTPNDFPDRATSPYGSARFHLDDAFALLAQHYNNQRTAIRSTSALARHAGHDIEVRPLFDQVTRMETDLVAARDLFEQYVWALAGDPAARAAVLARLAVTGDAADRRRDTASATPAVVVSSLVDASS